MVICLLTCCRCDCEPRPFQDLGLKSLSEDHVSLHFPINVLKNVQRQIFVFISFTCSLKWKSLVCPSHWMFGRKFSFTCHSFFCKAGTFWQLVPFLLLTSLSADWNQVLRVFSFVYLYIYYGWSVHSCVGPEAQQLHLRPKGDSSESFNSPRAVLHCCWFVSLALNQQWLRASNFPVFTPVRWDVLIGDGRRVRHITISCDGFLPQSVATKPVTVNNVSASGAVVRATSVETQEKERCLPRAQRPQVQWSVVPGE